MKRILKAGEFLQAFFMAVMTSEGFGILSM